MKREEIIKLAREAGLAYGSDEKPLGSVKRFAALVAKHERESCARVCEDIPLPKDSEALTHLPTIERCADAIRARGDSETNR